MPKTEGGISVVPANRASWEDLDVVLGPARCHSARCYCQRHKIPNSEWRRVDDDERAFLLRAETNCGNPESGTTSGWQEIAWGELHVGSRNAFAAAGFREASRPTERRVVMRLDFR